MLALILLVSALASARVWRLLTTDEITVKFRDWLYDRSWFWEGEDLEPSFWQRGFDCPFCLGFWITALFVLTGVLFAGTVWFIIAGAFAANYVGALLNAHFDK